MVIRPCSMPKVSFSTLATGARQLVVQEAADTTSCFAGSYRPSFTPITMVMSASDTGALMITFFAPQAMCSASPARFLMVPVDSTTRSTP